VLIDFDAALVRAFPDFFEGAAPTYTADDLKNAAKVTKILQAFDLGIQQAMSRHDITTALTGQDLSNLAFDVAIKATFPSYFEGVDRPSTMKQLTGDHPYLWAFDQLAKITYPQPNKGDIKVFGSQFKTEQGGSIDLLAPGGSVVAGLTSVPGYLASKSAAELGVFTIRGGDIRVFVGDDFLVNQGRVFTLGGGDITMISQNGDIDAGRGTKTASSAPPPLLTTDASGNTKLDLSGSIAGSGIATLKTSSGQEDSNVYAVAPRGTFDAGDAGVRSTGAVSIQAAVVLNANNIAAAGGVSNTVSVSVAPSAAAASTNTGTAAAEATKQLTVAPKETLALTVEVLGYGGTQDDEGDDEKTRQGKSKKL
jgi:hypothetical protein